MVQPSGHDNDTTQYESCVSAQGAAEEELSTSGYRSSNEDMDIGASLVSDGEASEDANDERDADSSADVDDEEEEMGEGDQEVEEEDEEESDVESSSHGSLSEVDDEGNRGSYGTDADEQDNLGSPDDPIQFIRVPKCLIRTLKCCTDSPFNLPREWLLALRRFYPRHSLRQMRAEDPDLVPDWMAEDYDAVDGILVAKNHELYISNKAVPRVCSMDFDEPLKPVPLQAAVQRLAAMDQCRFKSGFASEGLLCNTPPIPLRVLDFLDPQDLLCLSLVCKATHQASHVLLSREVQAVDDKYSDYWSEDEDVRLVRLRRERRRGLFLDLFKPLPNETQRAARRASSSNLVTKAHVMPLVTHLNLAVPALVALSKTSDLMDDSWEAPKNARMCPSDELDMVREDWRCTWRVFESGFVLGRQALLCMTDYWDDFDYPTCVDDQRGCAGMYASRVMTFVRRANCSGKGILMRRLYKVRCSDRLPVAIHPDFDQEYRQLRRPGNNKYFLTSRFMSGHSSTEGSEDD